jgi:hypothetical protein
MDDLIPIVAILAHSTVPIVLICATILGIVLVGPLKRWIAMKERATEQASAEAAGLAAEQSAKIARLEQRMIVLERILTDRSASLADEIDRLRDHPLN